MNKNIAISLLAAAILAGCGSDSAPVEDKVSVLPPEVVENKAPQAMSDTALVQNNTITTIDVLANDTDEDDDTLTISSIIEHPKSGTVEIVDNKLIYTPKNDVATTETITYQVSDGELTAEADIEVTVNHTMTISGLVTDSPIANALVSVSIGEDSFEVEADDKGNYTLPITINDMSAFIIINAKGNPINGQEAVELIAVAGQVSNLLALIDDDRQLTNDENNKTNITHVSTATYLLAKDRSKNGEITNEDEFNELVGVITTEKLLETAAFIKLLVDNTEYKIPAGETVLSILEVETDETEELTTSEAIKEYLKESELVGDNGEPSEAFELALKAAVEETISDPNVVEEFTLESFAGKVMIDLYGAKEGWNEYSGTGINFSADGTGESYNFQYYSNVAAQKSNFSWSVVDGGLNVVFLDNTYDDVSFYPYENLVTSYGFTQSQVDEFVEATDAGILMRAIPLGIKHSRANERHVLLASTPTSYQVNVRAEYVAEVTFLKGFEWKGGSTKATQSFSRNQVLVHTPKSAFMGKTLTDLEGKWVLNFDTTIIDPGAIELTEFISDLVTIEGTSAVAQFAKQEFTASLTDGVLVLSNNNITYKFTPFSSEGKGYLTKIEKWLDNKLEFVLASQIAKFDDSYTLFIENLVTELPSFQGSFINGSIEDHWDGDKVKAENIFGYQFLADGTLNRGVDFRGVDDTWKNYKVDHFYLGDERWTWDTEGRRVNMYRSDYSVYRHRTWEVISVDDIGRALVFEHSLIGWDTDFDDDIEGDEIGQNIRPRINTIMLDDLSKWKTEWQNTIDLGLFTPKISAETAKLQPTKVVTKKQREIQKH
jgi:hypothetical protein